MQKQDKLLKVVFWQQRLSHLRLNIGITVTSGSDSALPYPFVVSRRTAAIEAIQKQTQKEAAATADAAASFNGKNLLPQKAFPIFFFQKIYRRL